MNIKERFYYQANEPQVITELGSGSPSLVFNVCTHGNEQQPLYAVENFLSQFTGNLDAGTIRFIYSNPPAVRAGKRFLFTDLNRAFPGDMDKPGEASLAPKVLQLVKDADYVVDLHTSPSKIPFVILGQRDPNRLRLAEVSGVSNIVLFEANTPCAMVDFTHCGIGIEVGKHDDIQAQTNGLEIIKNYVKKLPLLGQEDGLSSLREYYEVFDHISTSEAMEIGSEKFNDFTPLSIDFGGYKEVIFPILCGVKDYTDTFAYFCRRVTREEILKGENHETN